MRKLKFWCRTFFEVLFILLSTLANAQVEKRDSLFKLLAVSPKDTGRVLLLIKIADTYETNNQDSSIYYLEKSKELADILNFKSGIYQYYEKSAIISFTKGDYNLSMQQSNNALEAAKALNDSNLIINILNNKGIVYQYLCQFDKQLDFSLQALAIAEKNNQKEKLPALYHNVANAYANLNHYRKSIDYCLLSVNVSQKTKGYNYLNRVYSTLAHSYSSLNQTDSALYYYKIAIKESVKKNDKYAEAAIYGFMANTYADRKEFSEMLKAAKTSLSISKELQSSQMLATSLYNLAYASYFNGDNINAKKYINDALLIATKDSLKDELKNIYSILSYITSRDGDFYTSLWAKKKYDSIQESILNEQIIQTTSGLEKKYELEKKDKQIYIQQIQLQKRTFLNNSLMGSTLTLFVIFLFFYLTYRHKQKLQRQQISELEKEKQLAAADAVLKGEEQERRRLAQDLHDGLGGLLSGIKYSFQSMKRNLIMTSENNLAFDRSMDMLDSSIKEMRRVAHNMMPEALVKFGLDAALNDFCNEINQSGALVVNYQSIEFKHAEIDQTTAITIFRIVQELINNIMKHAAAHTAIVQVSKTDNTISVTVEDDGKGFDPEILEYAKGIGWINIKSRVEYLSGSLDVQSKPGNGTSVHIELNI